MPNEDVIYLADTARVPYGGRSPEEILKINEEIVPYLIDYGAKLIVIACGTSSAIAYPVIKDKYKVQLVDMIGPGSRAAVAASRSGNIGLIATLGTVNSNAYQSAIHALKKEAKVAAQACPLFVPLIEGGGIDTEEARRLAKEYLDPLLKEQIDTLILGCTHYPHLAKVLREKTGPEVAFVDPAVEAVIEVKKLLQKSGNLKPNNSWKGKTSGGKYEYLVTGPTGHFEELGSRLLGKLITHAKHVII